MLFGRHGRRPFDQVPSIRRFIFPLGGKHLFGRLVASYHFRYNTLVIITHMQYVGDDNCDVMMGLIMGSSKPRVFGRLVCRLARGIRLHHWTDILPVADILDRLPDPGGRGADHLLPSHADAAEGNSGQAHGIADDQVLAEPACGLDHGPTLHVLPDRRTGPLECLCLRDNVPRQ